MEKKINLVELLKNCPKGMELDCVNYDGIVTFNKITNCERYPISINVSYNDEDDCITLTKYGQTYNSSYNKCIIFPKGKNSWEGFVPPCKYEDGNILVYEPCPNVITIYIYRKHRTFNTSYYVALSELNGFMINNNDNDSLNDYHKNVRFATEGEKQRLFDAIKAHGYKWNAKTKTLEKVIIPKFKVGDIVKSIFNNTQYKIIELTDTYYTLEEVTNKFLYRQPIYEVVNWELVSDKFDFSTLIPFESKVLVRDMNNATWKPSFWGCLLDTGRFETVRGVYNQCIPYSGNEYLLGRLGNCDEYFKIWK
jgi:hypothetical protein